MSTAADNGSPTRLSDSQFEECMGIALHYLKSNPFIRNRDIRAVAAIGYDQAIHFFNRAITEKRLTRELGQAGSGAELLSGEDVALRLRAAGERGATLAVGPSQGAGLQLLDGPSREASLDAGPLGRAEGPDLVLRSGAAAQVWVPAPAAP